MLPDLPSLSGVSLATMPSDAAKIFHSLNLPVLQTGKLQIFDDVLPVHLYAAIKSASDNIGWKFGWRTMSNPTSCYWHHEVGHADKANCDDISAMVTRHPEKAFSDYQDWLRAQILPPESKILRFYLNAHTYGTDGAPHYDAHRDNEVTLILYLNDEWRLDWAGETVVFKERGDIEKAVLPRKNRIFSFPSNRLHAPRPLAKACEGLRVVLVVKVALAPRSQTIAYRRGLDTMAHHLEYLKQIGSDAIPHSGRSLLAHLYGTHQWLRSRGADDELCAAGLFHSVYGTSIMRCTVAHDRQELRARIGERAERLTWLFSTLKRPSCWSWTGNTLPTVSGGTVDISEADMDDLKELERANVAEQGLGGTERGNLQAG